MTRSMLGALVLCALLAPTTLVAQGGPGGPGPGGGNTPPGLPPVPTPPMNQVTPAKAVLGKILFWDEQLSSDNTVACGTCHRPSVGGGGDPRFGIDPGPDGLAGTPDDRFGSPGIIRQDHSRDYEADPVFGLSPQVTRRTAPSSIMAAWFPNRLFWDGRATGTFVDPQTGVTAIPFGGALESQAVGPPVDDLEMAHESRDWDQIAMKLGTVEPLRLASDLPADVVSALQSAGGSYGPLFQAAFGDPTITSQRIAFAIATYERTLVADQTPVDAIRAGQNPGMVLTQQQNNGRQIFFGQGRCDLCHGGQIGSNGQFVNIGLRPWQEDPGRMEVTGNFGDRGEFRVPSLRNVGLRSRFMHNGQFTSLLQVVDFYNGGGDFANNRDPRIIPLGLNNQQRQNLAAFVSFAFTDPRVAARTGAFSRPTLRSEGVPVVGTRYGFWETGSAGIVPDWIAATPPYAGNGDFKVGVSGGLGGALAFFGIAHSSAPFGSSISGVPVNVNVLDPAFVMLHRTLEGTEPGEGYATVRAPIPDLPALVGQDFFGQWWIQDGGAPNGWSATQGLQITVF